MDDTEVFVTVVKDALVVNEIDLVGIEEGVLVVVTGFKDVVVVGGEGLEVVAWIVDVVGVVEDVLSACVAACV